jgi:hypothetical protein
LIRRVRLLDENKKKKDGQLIPQGQLELPQIIAKEKKFALVQVNHGNFMSPVFTSLS